MELKVYGEKESTINLSDTVFARDYNEGLVHQVITSTQSSARQNTKSGKNRSEVSGGGAKPWKQKGTGRARAGTSRGPLWRKGGITFAIDGINYNKKINKRMKRAGMITMISQLVREDRIIIIDSLEIAEPKTKLLVETLGKYDFDSGLIVLTNNIENCFLSARNIPHLDVISVSELSPVDLVSHKKILITLDAIKKLEEVLEK